MKDLAQTEKTISSREIAELTGKRQVNKITYALKKKGTNLEKLGEKRRTQETADIEAGLTRLVAIFKAIKEVIQAPILDEEQLPVTGLTTRLSHVLEVANVPAITAPEGEKA